MSEIDELRAALEAAQDEIRGGHCIRHEGKSRCERLTEELAELRRDAARYRYLRGDEPGCEGLGKAWQGDPSFYPYVVLHDPVCVDITNPLLKEELDAAVDRAIATPMTNDGSPT